jgi:hypothetical protein
MRSPTKVTTLAPLHPVTPQGSGIGRKSRTNGKLILGFLVVGITVTLRWWVSKRGTKILLRALSGEHQATMAVQPVTTPVK